MSLEISPLLVRFNAGSSLCFQSYPITSFTYNTEDRFSNESNYLKIVVKDFQTQTIRVVFLQKEQLQSRGISLTTWDKFKLLPEKLEKFLEDSYKTDFLLRLASDLARPYLSAQHLKFFTVNRCWATRVITKYRYEKTTHLRKIQDVPGIFFHHVQNTIDIFINLKGTQRVGSGSFGKVRKVVWLTAPDDRPQIVAKKVLKEKNDVAFLNEVSSLERFLGKKGILQMIASVKGPEKWAIFTPMYDCSLFYFLSNSPFNLTIKEKMNLFEQWLEGLCTIAIHGSHLDLSSSNLLFKKTTNGVEAVIGDLASFRRHGRESFGKTTWMHASPEYYEIPHRVSPKLDIWGFGISMQRFFSDIPVPVWDFMNDEDQVMSWLAKLQPGWVKAYPLTSDTPPFIFDLIDKMLDPRPDKRPSAKELFDDFLVGRFIHEASQISAFTQDTTLPVADGTVTVTSA